MFGLRSILIFIPHRPVMPRTGACGHTYGNHGAWSMTRTASDYFPYTWEQALNHEGAEQMKCVKASWFDPRTGEETVSEGNPAPFYLDNSYKRRKRLNILFYTANILLAAVRKLRFEKVRDGFDGGIFCSNVVMNDKTIGVFFGQRLIQ